MLSVLRNVLNRMHRRGATYTLALAATGLAQAQCLPANGELVLPPGGSQTSLGAQMQLFGVPAEIRVLDIPQPVAQAARWLTERYPCLSDVAVYPQRIVLSGYDAHQLWLLSLEPTGPRAARGSLAILADRDVARGPSVAPNADATQDDAWERPAWLPVGARLRLQLEQREDGGRVMQQVWTSARSATDVAASIAAALHRAHWQPEALTATSGRWRQARHVLQIIITTVEGGSGILLQQYEEAQS